MASLVVGDKKLTSKEEYLQERKEFAFEAYNFGLVEE